MQISLTPGLDKQNQMSWLIDKFMSYLFSTIYKIPSNDPVYECILGSDGTRYYLKQAFQGLELEVRWSSNVFSTTWMRIFFKYLMIFFEVEQAEGTEELQKIIKYGKLFDENHF